MLPNRLQLTAPFILARRPQLSLSVGPRPGKSNEREVAMIVRINAYLLLPGVILLACVTWVLNEIGGEQHESSVALVAHAGDQYHHSVSYTFDGTPEGALPKDFQTGMTGEWQKTEWSIQKVEGNAVLAHVGFWEEDPDGVFPVAWVKNSKARDLRLTVRLFPVHPPTSVERAVHDGAGIVVRFMDTDNYYLLRSVPHETRVRFYKVENGKRSTLDGKDIDVPTGQWHELQLTARGSTFTAHFNGEKLFAHEDKTFEEAGAFGLWCKPNNVTYFDDLKADIFD